MLIRVFGKPGCQQCKMTVQVLKELEADFEYLDITKDQEAREEFETYGYESLPVVVAPGHKIFYGFRPDELKVIVASGAKW